MQSHLGQYVRQRREALGMRQVDLARNIGYRNLAKGCRRIATFESTGSCNEWLWNRVSTVLCPNKDKVRQALNRDREEYEAWLDEPVETRLILRLMPAVCSLVALPASVANDPAKAEKFAIAISKQHKVPACLAVSRRLLIWINEKGEVYDRSVAPGSQHGIPYSQIGGKKFLFGSPG